MMQVIFYQAKEKTFYGKLIAWWTKSQYTHCEIRFSDGINFSASTRDKGVRFKEFDLDPGSWSIIDVPCSEEQEKRMRDLASRYDGSKYDYRGILGFVYDPIFGEDNRWYCSEICAHILNSERLVYTPIKISPPDLHYVMNQIYGPAYNS